MSGREAVEAAVEEVFAVADAFSADADDAIRGLGMTTADFPEYMADAYVENLLEKRPRDAGSYIGNQAWNGVRGDPITGTHNGHLDADARARRKIKNDRHYRNRSGKNGATHL